MNSTKPLPENKPEEESASSKNEQLNVQPDSQTPEKLPEEKPAGIVRKGIDTTGAIVKGGAELGIKGAEKGAEITEKGFEVAGKSLELVGKGVEATGKGVQYAGKGVEYTGVVVEGEVKSGLKYLSGIIKNRRGIKDFFWKSKRGVITGSADNDPSGIVTYTQIGAIAGFQLLWLCLVAWPLLTVVEEMSARIGVVTKKGVNSIVIENYGRAWAYLATLIILICNTFTMK